ncbi:MAG: TonB-dependent receptor plug domain-containing protein, partial [Caulobacteraceae bacterium]
MNRRFGLIASSGTAAALIWAGAASAQTTPSNQSQAGTQPTYSGVQTPGAAQAAARAAATRQNVEAASAATVGELVVTAESHQQTLQKIPIAVSDFTDARRNLVGIEDEADIVNFTPSMSLNGQFLSLRGVGRYTDELGTDPGIAVFVDGIYTNSPDYLNQPDFLADHIEVLRGPQGTENGRNAIGGAVNIVEKRPTPDFREEARVGYNNYNYLYADAAVSGPIANNLEFRFAYAYGYQPPWDGYVKNLASGIYPGSGTTRLSEFQLQWTPTNDFRLWFKVQNFSENTAATYGVTPDEYPGFVSYSTPVSLAPDVAALLPPTSNPEIRNPWVVDDNTVGYVKLHNDWTYTLHATWSQPWGTIKYIGGYSQYTYLYLSDFDQTPLTEASALAAPPATGLPLIAPSVNQIITDAEIWHSYSNELRVSSNDNQRLKWVAGVFQYWQKEALP